MCEFKVGDMVAITDGSWAVRVDKHEKHTYIGLCRDMFEVTSKGPGGMRSTVCGGLTHDIFIKNTSTGAIYLHSSSFVKKADRRQCCCCKCHCHAR